LFNEFLENTLTSYGENDVLPEAECKFMQWKENKFIPLIPE